MSLLSRLKLKFSLLFFVLLFALPASLQAIGVHSTLLRLLSWLDESSFQVPDTINKVELSCEYGDIVDLRKIDYDTIGSDSLVAKGRRVSSVLKANWSFGNKGIGISLSGLDLDIKTHFTDEYFTGFEGRQNRLLFGTNGWLKTGPFNTIIKIQIPVYEFTTEMNPLWKRINTDIKTLLSLEQFIFGLGFKRYTPPSTKLVPFLAYTGFELPWHPSMCGTALFASFNDSRIYAEIYCNTDWFRTDSVRSKQGFSINAYGNYNSVKCSVSTQLTIKPFLKLLISTSDIKTEARYGTKPFLGLDTLHFKRYRFEMGAKFLLERLSVSLFHDNMVIKTDSGLADAFPFSGWAALFKIAYRIDSAALQFTESGLNVNLALLKETKHSLDAGLCFSVLNSTDTLVLREKQRINLFFFALGPHEGYSSGGLNKLWLTPKLKYIYKLNGKWSFTAALMQHIPMNKPSFDSSDNISVGNNNNYYESIRGGTILNLDILYRF